MKYCIIINTYNRSLELVERSLKAALSQKILPKQIILVDQNFPPLNLSEDIKNSRLIFHQFVTMKSVSEARNAAIYPRDIDWISFCDDDGYMDSIYSEKLQELIMGHPGIEIFAGSIIRDDTFDFYTPRQALAKDINRFQNTKLLMGSNFVVRRNTFELLEKFDPRFGAGSIWGSGEETDFAWKAYFKNVPMLYEKDLKVFHVRPYFGTLEEANKKAYRYGNGKGALVYKWLVERKKLVVLYELMEMYSVPTFKIMKGLICFNRQEILTAFYSLLGRTAAILKCLKSGGL